MAKPTQVGPETAILAHKVPRKTGGQPGQVAGRRPNPGSARVVEVCPVDDGHQVVSCEGGPRGYRRQPCSGCPWRKDQVGQFPAGAFVESARTAYDMAPSAFACHESGTAKPATCAGFLLRGADHNLSVRLKRMQGELRDDVHDGGHQLFESYRAMAEANGVATDHPALERCRSNDESSNAPRARR